MTAAKGDPRAPARLPGEESGGWRRLRVGGWDVGYMSTRRAHEVQSRTLRAGMAILAIFLGLLLVPVEIVIAGFLIVVSVPVHLVLRALGRVGFLTVEGRRLTYAVGRHGFGKRT